MTTPQDSDHADFGHVLDHAAEIDIASHSLPHWMQDGAITFITIRLADSIPREVHERWDREKLTFLANNGITTDNWMLGRDGLCDKDRRAFDKQFQRMKQDELDLCHGRCQLQDPRAAKIVADAMLHFDSDRYFMGDLIIMPNHLHCLVVFPNATRMRKQCYSWTHYSAVQVNRLFGKSGTLWQDEPFDHLVRSENQLTYLRDYIQNNPVKAKLTPGQFLYRRSPRNY